MTTFLVTDEYLNAIRIEGYCEKILEINTAAKD